jgi:apolipoprotein D and lipocalin family protein
MKARTLALLGGAAYGLYRLSQQTCVPAGVQPLHPFELTQLLGRWYGIARLDYLWERGLSHTTADYSLRPDGRVQVQNRGWDPQARRWRQATGTASPVHGADTAHLAVSFMRPLRASYIVFGLEGDGQQMVVSGRSHDYLWLLSRTPTIRPAVRAALLERARAAGFDVDKLVWVGQGDPPPPGH